jgi:hypothetical protein
MSEDRLKSTPHFESSSDPIERFLTRGKIKGHHTNSELNRARADEARAFEALLDARVSLAKKLNYIQTALPTIMETEATKAVLEAKHGVARMELQHATELEQLAHSLIETRALSAPKPLALPAPQASLPLPPTPPPPASQPIAPPPPPRAPIVQGFTPSEVRNVLERLHELSPETRDTIEAVLRQMQMEKDKVSSK